MTEKKNRYFAGIGKYQSKCSDTCRVRSHLLCKDISDKKLHPGAVFYTKKADLRHILTFIGSLKQISMLSLALAARSPWDQ